MRVGRFVNELGTEIVRIARSTLSAAVLVAVTFVTCVTHLVVVNADERMPGAPWAEPVGLVRFPEAFVRLLEVQLVFGSLLVAAYAGVLGFGRARTYLRREKTASVRVWTRLRPLVALVMILLPGTIVAYLAGIGIALGMAALAGRPISGAFQPAAVGELPGLVTRGWLAVLPVAALAYAAGAVSRRRSAGVIAVAGLVLVEQTASLFASGAHLAWTPIANAAAFVDATTAADLAARIVATAAYVIGSAMVVLYTARKGSVVTHRTS